MNKNKKIVAILAVIIGILFIVVAFIYWTTPANLLPGFLPGHDIHLTKIHYTHGLGSFILAIVLFVFAWFQTGKKSTK